MINEKASETIRSIIDTNGDGYCSNEEIQAFDKKWDLAGTFNPNIYNLFAYTKKAIIPQTLFANRNCADRKCLYATCDKSADDIVGKSIITENDFKDLAGVVGKGDSISKNIFDVFDFDANGDGIIDENEYKIGMQKVHNHLRFVERFAEQIKHLDLSQLPHPRDEEEVEPIIMASHKNKECNNETATTIMPDGREINDKSTI